MIAPAGGNVMAAELHFPVEWEFRIVVEGAQYEPVRQGVVACLKAHGATVNLSDGLQSGSGRYRTIRAAVTLTSREMMERLAADLAALDGVRFVL